jgi:hypothetical protein
LVPLAYLVSITHTLQNAHGTLRCAPRTNTQARHRPLIEDLFTRPAGTETPADRPGPWTLAHPHPRRSISTALPIEFLCIAAASKTTQLNDLNYWHPAFPSPVSEQARIPPPRIQYKRQCLCPYITPPREEHFSVRHIHLLPQQPLQGSRSSPAMIFSSMAALFVGKFARVDLPPAPPSTLI